MHISTIMGPIKDQRELYLKSIEYQLNMQSEGFNITKDKFQGYINMFDGCSVKLRISDEKPIIKSYTV